MNLESETFSLWNIDSSNFIIICGECLLFVFTIKVIEGKKKKKKECIINKYLTVCKMKKEMIISILHI